MQPDLLIHDGTVIDGTAAPPFRADVAIRDGRIHDIGTIEKGEGVPCIDAQGLFVAPGFIDIHSHSDFTIILDLRAMSSITQGVTLEVVGNCGHGCAPIGDPELAKMNIYGHQEGHEIGWRTCHPPRIEKLFQYHHRGKVALKDGELTGKRSGHVLRRG